MKIEEIQKKMQGVKEGEALILEVEKGGEKRRVKVSVVKKNTASVYLENSMGREIRYSLRDKELKQEGVVIVGVYGEEQKAPVSMADIELMDRLSKERYEAMLNFEKKLKQEVYKAITSTVSKKPNIRGNLDIYDMEVRIAVGYPEEFGASFDISYTGGEIEYSMSSTRVNKETPRTKELLKIYTDIMEQEKPFIKGLQRLLQDEGYKLKRTREDLGKVSEETKKAYFESELYKKRKEARG